MQYYKLSIIFSYIVVIFSISSCVTAQGNAKLNPHEIQYVNIENNTLVSAVQQLIEQQKLKNNLFKNGYGYVTIDNIEFRGYNTLKGDFKDLITDNDTLITFTTSLSSYLINGSRDVDCFNCNYYPPFYTYIDNTLVLIYDKTFNWLFTNDESVFSNESKKQLTDIIRKLLKESLNVDFIFYDPFSSKEYSLNKKERETLTNDKVMSMGAFTLRSGQSVSILRNGNVKIRYYE
jgi:hypothetical protein